MGRLPLTWEKRLGYRVDWLHHYHILEIMAASRGGGGGGTWVFFSVGMYPPGVQIGTPI